MRSTLLYGLLLLVGLMGFHESKAQSMTTNIDTSLLICGDSTTLSVGITGGQVNTSAYTVQSIPFAPEPVGGTQLTLFDDSFVGPFNIGFSFGFYCNTYTQFYLCSNGWITFQPQGFGWNTNYTPNQLADILPTTLGNVPKNCIMGPWKDWNPGSGGQVRYQTIGTAPCRKLVVSWSSVPMFSCGSNQGTFQIVLEETTNRIENHITSAPFCNTWQFPNTGWGTQSIHNQAGTNAVWNGTRNATTWTATNESTRWQPSAQIYWYNQAGILVDSGNCITAGPNVASTYYAQTTTCNNTVLIDSSYLAVSCIQLDLDSIDVACAGDSTGWIIANDTSGTVTTGVTWYVVNAAGDTIITTNTTVGTDTFTGLPDGTYTVIADLGNTNIAFGAITINAPNAMTTMPANIVQTSCFGSGICDGQGAIVPTGGQAGYQFNWANGVTAAFNQTLCFGDNYVTVTDANGCSVIDTVNVPQPDSLELTPAPAQTICIGNVATLTASAIGGTQPYTFLWSNGQNGSSVTANPTVTTTYTVQLLDANGCIGPTDSIVVTVNPPLSVTASTADDTICLGDITTLTAVGVGGDGNYSYAWSNGAPAGSPSTVSPTATTNYIVTVTDGCGTPLATDTVKVQVGGYPAIVATASPWPVDTICPGESANLSVSATGGFGAYTYTWNQGVGNGANHTVSPNIFDQLYRERE